MLALGDPADDFDVAMVEARGKVLTTPTPLELPARFAAKYAARLRELDLTPTQFARCYSTDDPHHPGQGPGLARPDHAAVA